MKIEIECVGCDLSSLEEMFVSTTLGSAVRSYDRQVSRAEVSIRAGRAGDSPAFRCTLELETWAGRVFVDGQGDSLSSAFMAAAERVDRALFGRLYSPDGASGAETGCLAA